MSPKAVKDATNAARDNRNAHGVIFVAAEGVLPRTLGRWERTPEVQNGFHLVYNPSDHALFALTIHVAYLHALKGLEEKEDCAKLTSTVQEEITELEGIITLCPSVSGHHASITKAVGEAKAALDNIRTIISTSIARMRAAMTVQH